MGRKMRRLVYKLPKVGPFCCPLISLISLFKDKPIMALIMCRLGLLWMLILFNRVFRREQNKRVFKKGFTPMSFPNLLFDVLNPSESRSIFE